MTATALPYHSSVWKRMCKLRSHATAHCMWDIARLINVVGTQWANRICHILLAPNQKDSMIWKASSNGLFHLSLLGPLSDNSSLSWKHLTPYSHFTYFFQLLSKGKLFQKQHWHGYFHVACKIGIHFRFSTTTRITPVVWAKPPANWLKFNIDGSFQSPNRAGIGGILRDWNRNILWAFQGPVTGISSLFVEFQALEKGLQFLPDQFQ
ncbi:hypothetical protein DH2020_047353 [Rehmannia glutinosa]|uniref:RNase H type-1 domain-containing protein n=1 Tax=Rehmannia glutinosa TaxID=99300 RepID=A0ABR0U9Q2_REHGL